jgi:hypothetical protein
MDGLISDRELIARLQESVRQSRVCCAQTKELLRHTAGLLRVSGRLASPLITRSKDGRILVDSVINDQREQQQGALVRQCPNCSSDMRLFGRESVNDSTADLLTFQCDCGQISAVMTQ